MQVILPRPGKTFGHCIEYLKAPNDCFASVPSDGLMLAMPRFEVEFKADLTRALTQLGIADAFVAGRADLSPIAPALNAAFIGHAAKLKVDEAGNAPPPGVAPMRQMLVDRPFLFSVVDGGTGQVLLTSAVLNP
jgi:serpin B